VKEPASPRAARVATALVGALPLGIFLLWGAVDGGYPPTLWLPGALALVGLLVLILVTSPQLLATLPRTAVAALGLLAVFMLWTALSIAWAGDKGEAWDAANRTLLYLAVYGIFLLWPWRARHGALLLGAYALGVAGIAAVTLVSLLGSDDPYAHFIGGRYAEPVGYLNANCALFLSAFWPAVFLASRRETPWWLRGLFLAAAGFLLEQAILPQSRGSLFVFPVVVVLYVALVPGRTRSLLSLAPACFAAYLVRGALLEVYPAWRDRTLPDALEALQEPLLGSAVALFALGTVYGLVDRFAPLPSDVARLGSWIVGIVAGVAAVGTALALLAVYGNPVTRAQDAWDEFSAGQQFEESSSYFGSSLGSNRYDFWRVALGELREVPGGRRSLERVPKSQPGMADADLGHDLERPTPCEHDLELGKRLEAAADPRGGAPDALGDGLQLAAGRGQEREDPICLAVVEAGQDDRIGNVATRDRHTSTVPPASR